MFIGANDERCAATFGRLPAEIVEHIKRFVLADPYWPTPEST